MGVYRLVKRERQQGLHSFIGVYHSVKKRKTTRTTFFQGMFIVQLKKEKDTKVRL